MNNNISSTKKLVIDESEPTQVDIVVHLGAGSGADVDYYQSLSPSHIYLFEGVISQCELLSQRFNVTKNVSVHHKMINPFDSAVTFQQIQPTQFSGVACVDKFSKKFKNLKVIDELNIQPFSLQDVINQIPELSNNNLSEDNTSMLVIQLNGLEFDLINYSQYQALALFDNIVIQSIKDNASSAYETARSINKVRFSIYDL
jgi:serine/threonine protein phosphatase PrpC